MKLKKIYFDAFKSLLEKELEINNNCIGLVGINESGKSNLLYAINVLREDRKLTTHDTPKMDKKHNPALRFEFELNPEEREAILNELLSWSSKNTLIGENIKKSTFNVIYHVALNTEKKEERFFSLTGFELNKNYLILLQEYFNDSYKIRHQDSFIPLSKAIIIKESDIKANDKFLTIYDDLKDINKEIKELEASIKINNADKNQEQQDQKNNEVSLPENTLPTENILNTEMEKIKEKLAKKVSKRDELISNIKDFDLYKQIASIEEEIKNSPAQISQLQTQLKSIETKISEFEKAPSGDENIKKQLNDEINNQKQKKSEIIVMQKNKKQKEKELAHLGIPLEKKYTSDVNKINTYLGLVLHDILIKYLPKVAFWRHDEKFILQSETLFSNLLDTNNLDSVSRPLVNIFRVGLGIKTIDDLHSKINEIKNDPNERSKLNTRLNKQINLYIKSVWSDYDQKINISLENDRIRIEIYDPAHDEASYYNMNERSQGAQTFISFLLTVGAEAKQGVIKDTILLLDEPETHLHPSGVRFLLKELIKIANKDNIVIYATHSIFMIDRENYNRHIILGKEKEQTIIKPSSNGRIGFFMQEEVLYSTLDIDFDKDFTSTQKYNFIFEGDGDKSIFKHFFNTIKPRPFNLKDTSYYHGGGCKNIEKYLNHKPIKLGTSWIFILDKDKPADNLRLFIEGRYKHYIDKDIYIFQYEHEKFVNAH